MAVAEPKMDELKKAFAIQTGTEALNAIAESLPAEALDRLVAKKSKEPWSFLIDLLVEAAPHAAQHSSTLDRAALRGLRVRQDLFAQEGGLASAAQLATFFEPQLTRQAVDERRKKKQLLALEDGSGHFKYPVWQVHDGASLPGLVDVLGEIDVADQIAVVVFFLQPDPRLKGRRPLDTARGGDVKRLLQLARTFGEHGAL